MLLLTLLTLLLTQESHGVELDSQKLSDAIANITANLGVATMQVSLHVAAVCWQGPNSACTCVHIEGLSLFCTCLVVISSRVTGVGAYLVLALCELSVSTNVLYIHVCECVYMLDSIYVCIVDYWRRNTSI